MRNRRLIISYLIVLFFCASGRLSGQEITEYYLIPPRSVFDLPQRIDPDEPVLSYSNMTGLWKAMIGQEILLYGLESPVLNFYVGLTGFLELHNLTTYPPVPWELLRANVGFDLFFQVPPLDNLLFPKTRIMWQVQCNHESDHILGFRVFETEFLTPPLTVYDFDYVNCSAFDYLKVRMTYVQKIADDHLRIHASTGIKWFFYLNQFSPRALTWAWSMEAGIDWSPAPGGNTIFNLALFYETIKNDFVSGSAGNTHYRIEHNGEDYGYLSIRLALEMKNDAGFAFMPFVKYVSGSGRGADFLKTYRGLEFGVACSF